MDAYVVSAGWPELATALLMLVCADATERQLFQLAGVREPTGLTFSLYSILTFSALAVYSSVAPEHRLHNVQLFTLGASWIAFWVLHFERLAVLLTALTALLCLYMLIDTRLYVLFVWLAYLSMCGINLVLYLRSVREVRFPGRQFSRWRTPSVQQSANSLLLAPRHTQLCMTQEIRADEMRD